MKYVGAIDQGTTSTRFMIFSSDGAVVSSAQIEHRQICPKPGWVEHDADEIWRNTCRVIFDALDKAGKKVMLLGVNTGILDLGGNLFCLPNPPPGKKRDAYRIGIRNPLKRLLRC